MSADLYAVERAVIIARAVILAVVDSAADVFVCKFGSHSNSPFKKIQHIAVTILCVVKSAL